MRIDRMTHQKASSSAFFPFFPLFFGAMILAQWW
jgi:hypothetical protein